MKKPNQFGKGSRKTAEILFNKNNLSLTYYYIGNINTAINLARMQNMKNIMFIQIVTLPYSIINQYKQFGGKANKDNKTISE